MSAIIEEKAEEMVQDEIKEIDEDIKITNIKVDLKNFSIIIINDIGNTFSPVLHFHIEDTVAKLKLDNVSTKINV